MTAELIVLRLLHVLGAIFWLGSGIFSTFFLVPTLKPGTPAFGEVMGGLARRKLFTLLPVVAVITMLSGARLMMILSDNFSPAWFELASGRTYTWAGAASVVAFVLSLAVSRPSSVRAGQLMGQRAAATSEAERGTLDASIARLKRRSSLATGIAMTLLILSASGMAVARYL